MNWYFIASLLLILLVFSLGVHLFRGNSSFGSLFGYRSYRSMRNDDTWLEANGYAGRCLMLGAFFMFICLFIMELWLPNHHYLLQLMLCFFVLSVLVTIALTESRLGKVFFKDGKRRPTSF